ncbi:hypothetical protein PM082_010002 [Marasmius tenuissimus]|nr:hypothetical protein PM082_010002 [Marasmius tenuissimus]
MTLGWAGRHGFAGATKSALRTVTSTPQPTRAPSSDLDELHPLAPPSPTPGRSNIPEKENQSLPAQPQAQPTQTPASSRKEPSREAAQSAPTPSAPATKSSKSKPQQKDFDGSLASIAQCGPREMEARFNTRDPFPDPTTLAKTAKRCLESTCKDLGVEVQSSPEILKLFGLRQSRARQIPLDHIRACIPAHYGLCESQHSRKKQENVKRVRWLLEEERYAHKDPTNLTGYLENSIFPLIYKIAYFARNDSHGKVFPRFFEGDGSDKRPSFPSATLALIKLQVEFCLQEWAQSGERIPAEFKRKPHQLDSRFQKHLADVEEWIKSAPAQTAKIRNRWHKRAAAVEHRADMELPSRTENNVQRVTAALLARTGDTDSEDDNQLEDSDEGSERGARGDSPIPEPVSGEEEGGGAAGGSRDEVSQE